MCSAWRVTSGMLYATCLMLRSGDNPGLVEPSQETRKYERPAKDRDALLEAKDQTIAELKEQVAFLRRALERKDVILARMSKSGRELGPTPEAPDSPRAVTPERGRNGNRPRNARREREEERPVLPDGYRVVAVASDTWVLITQRGTRVAVYRGELDLRRAALDAHEHCRRE